MRWILRRWLLAGGKRSFLAGYAGCPLLLGLVAAIVTGIADHSVAESLRSVPGVLLVTLLAYVLAPLGPIAAMASGISRGWGLWDGRLVYMGLMAGLVVLVAAGRRLEQRNPVPDGGDDAPRVPSARVVTAQLFPTSTWNRLIGRLATVAWNQLAGPVLLVIAGACFFLLGCAGLAVVGSWD